MGALLCLDVSDNNLGELVPPEGWTKGDYISGSGKYNWFHTDGRKEEGAVPSGSTPDGIVALADAIPDVGALTSLNLSSNGLEAEGAKIVAEAIKVTLLLRSCWHCFYAHLITG
jgi:hypothetical protein